ncbi:metallophosphoesterase [Paraglaciecola arctica]|uniref:metallophosphoesterase n=1 Tax=Paraglaciecola arctica TaxID=1128911 RepID=UPI001C070383|nr:metallophosphoesterase [Paraglaciecola arctica]MBU3004864.1 metallophosphoesterase [Paraglaciecola arctica]
MKIIQISDCHLFAEITKVGYNNINPFHSLKKLLANVKIHQPEVVLVTGDISGDGTAQSYQHFSNLLQQAEINSRIAVIPGNHDNQQQLSANINPEYLWLQHSQLVLAKQWHIHLLNTQTSQSVGKLSIGDLNGLSEYINRYSNDYHLLAAHHHPIPCGGWMDKHEWTNRQQFNAVVANNPSIKGVIYGHIHTALEEQVKHCLYMACPSTCWQFANQKSFAISHLKPGFRVINLLENGQITTSIHRIEE